ncbi:MAG TPA: HPr family phosphocarrier protein, partial [Firmicutes bacterium]|nr:HPr family phosphocarrier protein [Bacillota bacterium]
MRPGSEQQTTEGESKGHTVKIRGIGASAGVAIGPALVIRPQRAAERRQISAGDVPAELDRLQQALGWVKEELTAARKQAERQAGEQQAAIFDAQLLMLEDPQLQGRAEELIREQLVGAEWAVQTAAQEAAAVLAALPDEYLRARAGDVLDVGRRVVAALTAHGSIALTAPAI